MSLPPLPSRLPDGSWDYLGVEALLKARLKEQFPGFHVLSAAELEGVSAAKQLTPALHVIYAGDELSGGDGERSSTGDKQVVHQCWLVVLAVRNVQAQATGEAARASAGETLWKILAVLSGWRPSDRWGPLRRAQGPRNGYDGGFAYFPFLWKTKVVTP